MGEHVLVWDIETVPDLAAAARVHALAEGDLDGARGALGAGFAKLPLHEIVCIGALIAERVGPAYEVRSLGAPHSGEHSEAGLIQRFVDRIDALRPRMVTYNGASFDLPVLRYRAMVHRVPSPGLDARGYFRRYTEDALDLCDVLACFDGRGKVGLNDLCRVLGLPGKPDGIDGAQVAEYVAQGRLPEVARYCESDVVNTYRVFLVYELFRGGLTRDGYEASEANLAAYLRERIAVRPHLTFLLGVEVPIPGAPIMAVEMV